IRPNLRFNKHDRLWADRAQGSGNAASEIEWIIDLADVGRQFALQFPHAGSRSGGHHNLQVRQARFEHSDKLRANIDLANAHCMHPECMTIGNGLLELCVEPAKALAKALLP